MKALAIFVVLASSLFPDVPVHKEQREYQNQPAAHQSEASPSATASSSDHQPSSRANVNKDQNSCWDKFLEWTNRNANPIIAISTAVMAAFTVALFAATYLLWKSGEKHSERELRAYVSVPGAGIGNFGASKRVQAKLHVRNCGQTPAYDLSLITTLGIRKLPRHDFEPSQKIEGLVSKGTVGPGDFVEVPQEMETALTPEICERIQRREIAIFFFGKITYRDAFEKQRFTNFRYIAEPTDSDTLNLTPTEDGNDSN